MSSKGIFGHDSWQQAVVADEDDADVAPEGAAGGGCFCNFSRPSRSAKPPLPSVWLDAPHLKVGPHGSVNAAFKFSDDIVGKGRTSAVWVAIDRITKRHVAIKQCSKMVLKEQRQASSRVSEVELLAALQGPLKPPQIPTLLATFEDASFLYLVSDLCFGGDLFSHIASRPLFSEHDASGVVHQLLEALAFLHEKGIIHRDVCPDNLLFASPHDASLRLVDFGAALALPLRDSAAIDGDPLEATPPRRHGEALPSAAFASLSSSSPAESGGDGATSANDIDGHATHVATGFRPAAPMLSERLVSGEKVELSRAFFAAPEVVAGEAYDAKSDCWSVGAVAFVIAGGIDPRGTEDAVGSPAWLKLQHGHVEGLPETISHLLEDFLLKLLTPNKSDRLSATEAIGHPWISCKQTLPKQPLERTIKYAREYIAESGKNHAHVSKMYYTQDHLKKSASKVVYSPAKASREVTWRDVETTIVGDLRKFERCNSKTKVYVEVVEDPTPTRRARKCSKEYIHFDTSPTRSEKKQL